MSGVDWVNYMHIRELESANRNQDTLQDLQSKADYLAKKDGPDPVSWHEFKREHPPHHQTSISSGIIGAIIGTLVGVGLARIVGNIAMMATNAALGETAAIAITTGLAATGTALGGLVGYNHFPESAKRNQQLKKYEAYLENFEHSLSQGRAKAPEQEKQQDDKALADEIRRRFTEQLNKERAAERGATGAALG